MREKNNGEKILKIIRISSSLLPWAILLIAEDMLTSPQPSLSKKFEQHLADLSKPEEEMETE